MYNPLRPNSYRDCKLAQYHRQREAERSAGQAAAASPDFLAEALSGLGGGGSGSGGEAPIALNAPAEELHRQRVSRSAAMGIQSAVEIEKDSLELEHKRRRLDGTDTKSRIAGLLSRMRKSSVGGDGDGDGAPPQLQSGSPSALPTDGPASTPLVFKPSPLAAGGYVMAAADAAPGRRALSGKPTSTLLLRWAGPSPAAELAAQPAAAQAQGCSVLAESVRGECGRFGALRSVKVRLLTADEEAAKARAIREQLGEAEVEPRLARERLRALVRLGSASEAIKVAEELLRSGRWCVDFFPTGRYDAEDYGFIDNEPLCN